MFPTALVGQRVITPPEPRTGVDALGVGQVALLSKVSIYELPTETRPRVRDDLVHCAAREELGQLFDALDVLSG